MNTPINTFDTNLAQRIGINTTYLSDEEIDDITTIASTLDAFGDTKNLHIFFEEYKDNLLAKEEYLKVHQVNKIEKRFTL